MSTEGSGASRASDDLHNEDAFLVRDGEIGVYAVCDGVGSLPFGEVAAGVAIEAIEEFVAGNQRGLEAAKDDAQARAFADGAIRHAVNRVVTAADQDPDLRGMATTVTMLLAIGRVGVVGHVGDSRAYLVRRGSIHRLTTDHEMTTPTGVSAKTASDRGSPIETFCVDLRQGDTFLLCTDGAEEVIEHPSMAWTATNTSPRLLASRVVSVAHKLDSGRDATVVAVRVRSESDAAWLSLSRRPRPVSFGHAIAFSPLAHELAREADEEEREGERRERRELP